MFETVSQQYQAADRAGKLVFLRRLLTLNFALDARFLKEDVAVFDELGAEVGLVPVDCPILNERGVLCYTPALANPKIAPKYPKRNTGIISNF